MGKKILITGASGFIGSFFVEEALKRGWEVWAGVRTSSSLVYLTDAAIHFIDLKYADEEGLQRQIEQQVALHGTWDYVIHSAGITKSVSDVDFNTINFIYTKHLIDALRNTGNISEKFVFISSIGAVGPGDEKTFARLTLEDTPNPNSAYGKSKIQAEKYLQSLPDFPYVILRPTGVYGPRERDYYVMARMIKAGLKLSLGLKPQLLNFIFINDLVKVCFSAIESPLKNKIWFVADGDVYTSKAYANILKEILQKERVLQISVPLFVVWIFSAFAGLFCRITGKPPLINQDKYKILKQRNWTCDISSLEKDLGFKADFTLRQGMEATVAWYRNNGWL